MVPFVGIQRHDVDTTCKGKTKTKKGGNDKRYKTRQDKTRQEDKARLDNSRQGKARRKLTQG